MAQSGALGWVNATCFALAQCRQSRCAGADPHHPVGAPALGPTLAQALAHCTKLPLPQLNSASARAVLGGEREGGQSVLGRGGRSSWLAGLGRGARWDEASRPHPRLCNQAARSRFGSCGFLGSAPAVQNCALKDRKEEGRGSQSLCALVPP